MGKRQPRASPPALARRSLRPRWPWHRPPGGCCFPPAPKGAVVPLMSEMPAARAGLGGSRQARSPAPDLAGPGSGPQGLAVNRKLLFGLEKEEPPPHVCFVCFLPTQVSTPHSGTLRVRLRPTGAGTASRGPGRSPPRPAWPGPASIARGPFGRPCPLPPLPRCCLATEAAGMSQGRQVATEVWPPSGLGARGPVPGGGGWRPALEGGPG